MELDRVVASVPGLAIRKTWSTVLVGWALAMKQDIEAEFSRLETFFSRKFDIHSAQANSLSRPIPWYLTNLAFKSQNLAQEIIAKAPGLHMKRHHKTAVIGRDEDKVDAEIASMEETVRQEKEQEEAEERARLEKKEAEKKARWERRSPAWVLPYAVALKNQRRKKITATHTATPKNEHDDDLDENDLDDEAGFSRPPILAGFSSFSFSEDSSRGTKRTRGEIPEPYGFQAARALKRQRADAPNQPEE
ncbi:predicted protein [Chaetomium globosum CBS 148.51]|uniref:Uncharacterized protein n=1 Tax=Chaetomium globosum (strain ATCC 6205 / CBS 148.51 / DSM 1962 / NBRC 6347 / NRRL 1970) TaxID=306901 RepID=Q2H8A3_CHAGB|nr:uncharacterized protein CHGG_03551 [Chaetomium globosum CBS 148.51]EAQ91616.1 predicted protein [Chaetomium globosum CBS 148.51]